MISSALRVATATALALILVSCHCVNPERVTQTSSIDALLSGVFDGPVSCGELKQWGDSGIGTFNKLDGELILMDGVVYQVKSDGKVYKPSDDAQIPFAMAASPAMTNSVELDKPAPYAEFTQRIDGACPNKNVFLLVKASGKFKMIRTRSVPAQTPPYPTLAEAAKKQAVFQAADIEGDIVGFRCPPNVKGLNVPGHHYHFLSKDKTFGGHILDFEMESGGFKTGACHEYLVLLPTDSAFGGADLAKDRASELEKVESGR